MLQSAFVIGGIYIVMCLILSGIARYLEIRTRRSPKLRGGAAVAGGGPAGGPDPRQHEDGTNTELIALQRGAGKFDGTSTGAGGPV